MKLRSVKYYFAEAFRGLFRNSIMTLTSVAIVASCVFIVVFSYCIAVNIDYALEQFENSVGLSVFIEDSLTTEQVESLYRKIMEVPHVQKAEFVSAEDALKNFEQANDAQELMKDLHGSQNPLRSSFTITLDSSKFQNEVIDALDSSSMQRNGVVKVKHARETMNLLISVNNVIRVISIVIILVLGILAVVIVMNTIKLTVSNRQNEITIMKYVGATDWFIKWPFVIEGVLIGIIGAFVPVLIIWVSYQGVIDAIYNNYEFLSTMLALKTGAEIFPLLIPMGVLIGAVIGIIGSVNSMRKYLRV